MSDANTTSNPSAPLKTSAFKVPGEGSSFYISLTTIGLMAVLWYIATNYGWI
jgi:taurine transport system permease protein